MKTLLISADLGRLKAYRVVQDFEEPSPRFEEILDEDFANLHSRFSSRNTDQAGRFPSGQMGMSYGERHEEVNEALRNQAKLVAETINKLAKTEGTGGIYFAAPQTIFNELLGLLEPEVRGRITKSLPLDLVKVPKLDLWRRFEKLSKG